MRILIVVHTYYPDHNGVQMVTQYLAEGLSQNNEVHVISEKKEGYSSAELVNGVSIKRIEIKKRGFRFVGDKSELLKSIYDYMPDVLICVCTQSWTFDWLKKDIHKMPWKTVLYTHGYSGLLNKYPVWYDLFHLKLRAFRYHIYWWFYYLNAYKYIERFDLVTYLSEKNEAYQYAKDHMLTNGMVLCNAVEDVFFENSVIERIDENERTDSKVRFIYVANYDTNKNQRFVINAFVEANMQNAELVLIGGRVNRYYQEIYAEYSSLDDELKRRIVFKVGVPRKEIPFELQRADVFVCGSQKEEYPIMLCEAAAKGLPIISTNVGHVKELEGCIVVDSKEEMTEAMIQLYSSPRERYQTGMKLRRYAMKQYRIIDKVDMFQQKIASL